MKAKEMFEKNGFYKMQNSHYVNGITYIKTLDKEYEEISFLLNYEDSLNKEDEKTLTILKNIENLEEEVIYAIYQQIKEIKEDK